ncbi:MAG TPA: hypothetical protein VJX66_28680 [Amycolatopsis sp.]|nr:hypothetical protein [Amycolatopsis sp.]
MAVRLTSFFRREEEQISGRRGISHELRSRFGFSLIQAPLRKQIIRENDVDLPEQRIRRGDGLRTTRPLETAIDLTPLFGKVRSQV